MKTIQYDQLKEDGMPHQDFGILLSPLFTWRGRDVYPVFGAEGDDDGGEEEGPDSEPDDDADDDTGKGSDSDSSDTVSLEKFEELRRQLSANDKARAVLEKQLKDINDAKKDELTKATERAEELEKTVGEQAKELANLRLQNAFLSADTGITWHDPADALDIAERRGYLAEVVSEDGKVDAAKLAVKLKELAKNKPNLVKDSDGSGGDKGKDKDQQLPSGRPVGSKGGKGGDKDTKVPDRYAKHFR